MGRGYVGAAHSRRGTRALWEPRPRGDAALDQRPHRAEGGAPTPLAQAVGRTHLALGRPLWKPRRRVDGERLCGSRALAAMQRSINGRIAPRAALPQKLAASCRGRRSHTSHKSRPHRPWGGATAPLTQARAARSCCENCCRAAIPLLSARWHQDCSWVASCSREKEVFSQS